ncbi:glycosyltransferase family 2 protein [Paracoccus sp. MC1854]|uniref:glycosyltransferase family 2 protein n=1 Tax=Paracoccus sp. MC1854 TaxID=2760306 RepID=UPI00160261FE|nr:glycosyltransferase family 2 protein [Paracoccus sp. MC1854]MBB1490942.1 glycosyltransferase family 2 protein [Paracoccus sp. MC1854]
MQDDRMAMPVPDEAGAKASLGHVLVSSMRDEGPYALEFVAHHRAIGFDRIFIASNDCRDGTDLLLDALDRAGAIIHHRSTVAPGEVPQHAAYAAMRKAHGLDRADWLMVLDADEFLDVCTGQGKVQDLTAATEESVDIVMLNARTFGTGDDPQWQPGLVTDQFTRRLPERHRANGPVKTLTRGIGRFRQIHNHSVMGYRGDRDLLVMRADGSTFAIPPGGKLWAFLRNVPVEDIRYGMAHYNHYAVKSLASFLLRQDRGRGAAPKGQQNDRHTYRYFDRIAGAGIRDTGFGQRHGARLQAEYARLMDIPKVAAAQAETERRHAALIEALAG